MPFTSVVVVRLPSATVAPLKGLPLPEAVTVPCNVPVDTGVQPGKLNAPMRVLKANPVTW